MDVILKGDAERIDGGREAVVEARDVVKRFEALEVVRSISFTIQKGECFGFLGPNGAGKTTTVKMISCVLPLTSGFIKVFGMDVRRSARKIKALLGVAPQENNLDPDLTVEDNLLVYARYFDIPAYEARRYVDELLDFLQLADKRKEKIEHISGGMKRRLILARALVNRPRLLILDEPTTGLDPQAKHLIWQKLRNLKKAGATMILTTHYMEEAEQLCDRIVIMDRGKIIASGTPRSLIHKYAGSEVIEVRKTENRFDRILGKLAGFPFSYELAGDTLFIFANDGRAAMRTVVEADGGAEVLHRRATLEDVFLRLTGRELRE